MALLGRRAWWMPRRLNRLVPDLDIEGETWPRAWHGARRRKLSGRVSIPAAARSSSLLERQATTL
jgi:hypothetical protein